MTFKMLIILATIGSLVACSDIDPKPEVTITPETSTVTSKEQIPAQSTVKGAHRDGTLIIDEQPPKNLIHTQDNKAVVVDKATYDRAKPGDPITTGNKR